MARLFILVEGHTEEKFVNDALAPYLYDTGPFTNVSAKLLGNARPRSRRGGIVAWSSAERDILRHLKEDREVMIALLVDYYALPQSGTRAWPGRSAATGARIVDNAILNCIRKRMGSDFDQSRFVPCVMMHEFEAMLFSDCAAFANAVGRPDVIPALQSILKQFSCPEKINDSPQTTPSKRILNLIPDYDKLLDGNRAVDMIGLQKIRSMCPHFANWLQQLENNARVQLLRN